MALTIYNIRKWYKMLTGKSILHVTQDLGKVFTIDKISGYYNNLTQKVLKQPELLGTNELPLIITETGQKIYFPVAIFQYGLGSYDLYLETGNKKYFAKFLQCCNWAIAHQDVSGAWSNFFFIYKDHPYGSMAQGEGASLIIRGYIETKNIKYRDAAKKALDFMLLPIEQGGTTQFEDEKVIFREYTHLPTVLNGWIFSLFGLYDGTLIFEDPIYKDLYKKSIGSLVNALGEFDNGFWSLYDMDKHIASPFYHNLHIAQMQALYAITNIDIFNQYAEKWKVYSNKNVNKIRAFIIKAIQKIVQ